MTIASKSTSLQSYNLHLYRVALHPEFFPIENRRVIAHGEYDFELWIGKGCHALRFEHSGLCVTEMVMEDASLLPEKGLVTTIQCVGERDHETEFNDRVVYINSLQTEMLTDHLFLGTYNELLKDGRNSDSVMSVWKEPTGKPNLSLVSVQRHLNEVHIQCYHLRSDCGLVLRTQTIFEINRKQKNGVQDQEQDQEQENVIQQN